jgi:hypothetical protein
MALLDYIQQQLPTDIANHLNSYNAEEKKFPNVRQYYYPNSDWFYEGTVRAVTFQLLSDWITTNAAQGDYLLLAEQPYPNYPVDQVVDIMISDNEGNLIFFDINADFNIVSTQADIPKLQQAVSQIKPLHYGFAIYCVEEIQAAISAKMLQAYQNDIVKALAIVKQ